MIKQIITLNASPSAVYDALLDEKQHGEFTHATANIDPKVGGEFSVWDGYAVGKNIELIPAKKIVQTWRASDWPVDSISKVTFVLTPTSKGTELRFTQENVPKEFETDIEQGWHDFYWVPMADYFKT